jgi:hypothetical protein
MIKSLAVTLSLLAAGTQGVNLGLTGQGGGALLSNQFKNTANLNQYIGGGNVNNWGANVYDASDAFVGGNGDAEANIIENLPQVRWGTDHYACPTKKETVAIGLRCGNSNQQAHQKKRRGLNNHHSTDTRCDFTTCFQRDSRQGKAWGAMHSVNPKKYKSNVANSAYPVSYPNYNGDHAGINAYGDNSNALYPAGNTVGGDCVASADDVVPQQNMPYGFGGWRDYFPGEFAGCETPLHASGFFNQCMQFHPKVGTEFKEGSSDDDERYTHYHFDGKWGHYRGSSPAGGGTSSYPHSIDAGWGSNASPQEDAGHDGWGPCYGHTPHKAMCAVETENGFKPLEDWLADENAQIQTITGDDGTTSMEFWRVNNLMITYNRHAQVSNGLGEVVGCSCRATEFKNAGNTQSLAQDCPNLVVNFKCRELVYACIDCSTGAGGGNVVAVPGHGRRRNILEGAIELHEQRRALAFAAHAATHKKDKASYADSGKLDGPCAHRCPKTSDLKNVGLGAPAGPLNWPGSGEVIYDNQDNQDGDPQPPGGPFGNPATAGTGILFPGQALLDFEYHGCSALNEAGADTWQTCLIGHSDGAHGC